MDESHDACIIVQTTDATNDIDTEFQVIAAMANLDADYEALVAEYASVLV